MEKELIINTSPGEEEIALLEEGKLVELHRQQANSNFTVGDIFLGSVKKLMPGLNAAFIDIGHKRDAFLHYTDLGPKLRSLLKYTQGSINRSQEDPMLDHFSFEPEIVKTGKINQVIRRRQPILVQILKEPISTKGPRLSCEITIPGRYIVLTPFSNVIAISKKISTAEERKRLHRLIESIKPKNFGLIVRTAAEGKKVADLHEELLGLISKWKDIHKQLRSATPPMKLLSELDKTSSILRDMLNDSFNKIVINNKGLYHHIKGFMENVAPDKVKIVSLHRSKRPIFEHYGIARQIKASFGKTSTMPSGAYLVIEHTEAMHVIDVNSGPKMQRRDQEAAALAVNMEAAKEIARQLRLRDLGGLIIIDFIDMRKVDHKIQLHKYMREVMSSDRAQHTVLPLSKFGLMQITRQRARPEVKINTFETCPTCKGSGKVTPTILLVDDIKRDLRFILQSRPKSKILLEVHPFVYAFLKKGFINEQLRLYFQYSKWIRVRQNEDMSIVEYKFFDGRNDEIRLN